MTDLSRLTAKFFSISIDTVETILIGLAWGSIIWFLFGLFNLSGIGLLVGAVIGSLAGVASMNRRRENLKKPTPPEYTV